MYRYSSTLIIAVVVSSLVATGCSQDPGESKPGGTTSGQPQTAKVLAGLFVDQAPPNGRSVADLKADTNASGQVVVHGRIGGRVNPFVDGAAVFLLADSSMKSCDELHGDSCKTPWDYCCEPRESLAANTATIQVVDANGKPLRIDLEGQAGMSPLAKLTIAGEIAQRDGGTLVINARRIYVEPSAN
jgi:hypothetical protein